MNTRVHGIPICRFGDCFILPSSLKVWSAPAETAIDTCIKRDILTDILLKEKAEVTHMLLTEYDEKRHLRNTFMEGREAGREEGLEEGLKEGLRKGLEKGRNEKLRELVYKKLDKGKSISEIAEDLEEKVSVIEQIVKS